MAKKRILDVSPYKYIDLERKPILGEDGLPLVVKVETDPETGEEKKQYAFRMEEVEREYDTERIKKDIAFFLGNSGMSQDQKFRLLGRDKYRRNRLADRIEESESDKVELTKDDYSMLESAFDEMAGQIPRQHRTMLDRVFDAPEIDTDKIKKEESENIEN